MRVMELEPRQPQDERGGLRNQKMNGLLMFPDHHPDACGVMTDRQGLERAPIDGEGLCQLLQQNAERGDEL